MECFPQVLKNVRTSTRLSVGEIPQFARTLRLLEEKLDGNGRILVRPSGTEPVIRVMVEGPDEELINQMADELCELVSNADRL